MTDKELYDLSDVDVQHLEEEKKTRVVVLFPSQNQEDVAVQESDEEKIQIKYKIEAQANVKRILTAFEVEQRELLDKAKKAEEKRQEARRLIEEAEDLDNATATDGGDLSSSAVPAIQARQAAEKKAKEEADAALKARAK